MRNMHLNNGNGRGSASGVRRDGYDRDPRPLSRSNTAINQDAYTAAHITHPNGKAQADLVRTAYVRARLRRRGGLRCSPRLNVPYHFVSRNGQSNPWRQRWRIFPSRSVIDALACHGAVPSVRGAIQSASILKGGRFDSMTDESFLLAG
ncbi:hypothetical protein DL764_002536 [Monosporascus ibericus]|uniref:Uncharacterized protein n=1 Tax=Monosporascus ibericus TaxID=155417 RepID=A0A4Q4TJZ4_9PEZI|nr:hypothetical protein DL764_002536 [Monosporascus ibericus]